MKKQTSTQTKGNMVRKYTPVHKGKSIVDKEANADYKEYSKVRDPKKFSYFTDYRRICRKIWKKIAESSIKYESGVYDKDFLYLVPQVVANMPFISLGNGKIQTNSHTKGDIYGPIFCNLFPRFNNFSWSLDGGFTVSYKKMLRETIDAHVPDYFFILPTLRENHLK